MMMPPFLFLIQQFFVTTGAQLFDPYYGTYYDPMMMGMYGGGGGYGFNPYYAYSPFNTMQSSSFSSPAAMGYGSSFLPSATMVKAPIMDFSPPAAPPPMFGVAPSSTPSLLSLLNPFGGLANGLGSLGAPTMMQTAPPPPPNPFQMNLGHSAASAAHGASPFGRQFRTRTRGGSLLGTEPDDTNFGRSPLLQAVSQRDSCEGDPFMLKRECKNSEKKN